MKIKIVENYEAHKRLRKRREWLFDMYSTPHLNIYEIIRYLNNFNSKNVVSDGVATETGYILQLKGVESDDPISFINIKEREKICELLIKREANIIDGIVSDFLNRFNFKNKVYA